MLKHQCFVYGAILSLSSVSIGVQSEENLSLAELIRTTLLRAPTILQQQTQVEGAKAGVGIAVGSFDPTVYATYGTQLKNEPIISYERPALLGLEYERSYQHLLKSGIFKKFRNGITADFSVNLFRNKPLNGIDEARALGLEFTTRNDATIDFNVTIPLLKGAWSVSAAAGENAAKLQSEASQNDLTFVMSTVLLNAINAYWDYKTADEIFTITQESMQSTEQWSEAAEKYFILKSPEKIAQMKQEYAAEISAVEAFLADQKLKMIRAQQNIEQRKTQLAVAMGLDYSEFDTVTKVSIDYPRVEYQDINLTQLNQQWVADALRERSDIAASRLRQQAEKVLVDKFEQDLLPQLDVKLGAGYQALREGSKSGDFFSGIGNEIPGPNVSGQLTFSYPLGNHVQEGLLDRQNASFRQKTIALNDLARRISAEIDIDSSLFERRLKEEYMSKRAVDFYLPTVEKLSQRIKSQVSVILDLLNYQDRLVSSRISHIQARNELAKLIAKIRFQTGRLIIADHDIYTVNLQGLTEL